MLELSNASGSCMALLGTKVLEAPDSSRAGIMECSSVWSLASRGLSKVMGTQEVFSLESFLLYLFLYDAWFAISFRNL